MSEPKCKLCDSVDDVKAIQVIPGTTAFVLLCASCREAIKPSNKPSNKRFNDHGTTESERVNN